MTDEQTIGADAPAPPEAAQLPPLTRSAQHRVVAGVCGGLGRHLDIDPVVFRVVVAVLCLTGGLGLFLYGLAWLIVPREPTGDRPGRTELQRVLTGRVDGQSIGAVLLTVIGTGVFFSSMGDGGQLFPLLLLGGLVFVAVRYDPERRRRARGLSTPQRPGGPYDRLTDSHEHLDWKTWSKRFSQDFHAEWQVRRAEMHAAMQSIREQHAQDRAAGRVPSDSPPPGPTGYLWDPRHPERNPYGRSTPPPGAPTQAWWQRTDLPEGDPLRKPTAPTPEPAPAAVRVRQRRHRSFLGPLGLLLAAAAGSLAWLVTDLHSSAVRLSTVAAAALLALGLTMLVGAKFGRARGLTVPAVLLTLALAGTAGTHATLHGAVGDRSFAPTTATGLQSDYLLGVGDLSLDLSGLAGLAGQSGQGGALATHARVGTGDLHVTLPADMDVRLSVDSALGDVSLPNGEHLSGAGSHRQLEVRPLGGQPAKGTLDLKLTMGIGDITVVQQ